jgi:DNA ligase (NAD+)
VIVTRAGDVRPDVVSLAPGAAERPGRPPAPRPPAVCPSCGTPTEKPAGVVFTRCPNRRGCPAQRWQLLKHFVTALEIDGLGERQVAQLLRRGLVTGPADLYELTVDRLVELEGIGPTSARKLLDALAASRERPFPQVLLALGLEGVGPTTARNLAFRFRSAERLLGASAAELAETPGVGARGAATIAAELGDPVTVELVRRLTAAGLRFEQVGELPGGGRLAGRTVVLTGTLEHLTREQAALRVLEAGGRVTTSVSRQTDIVVAGEAPGAAKLERAERLGVPVVDEAHLLALLDGDGQV